MSISHPKTRDRGRREEEKKRRRDGPRFD